MTNNIIIPGLFVSLFVLAPLSAQDPDPPERPYKWQREIDLSEISQEELIAVPIDTDIYLRTQEDFADLLIVDENDKPIPFLIRKQKTERTRKQEKVWKPFSTDLKPVGDQGLELRIKLHPNDSQLKGLRFITPLKNFEQQVQIYAVESSNQETLLVDDAVIFDYSKYMDVRSVNIDLPETDAKEFRILIDQLNTNQQSQLLQLTRQLSGGKEITREIRTTIERRPFRIDRIDLWTDIVTYQQTLQENEYSLVSTTITNDDGTNETIIDLETQGEPVTTFTISTPDRNFQRKAILYKVTREGGEVELLKLRSQTLKRFDFRDLQKEELSINFESNRHRHFRITIENMESPELKIDEVHAHGEVDQLLLFAQPNQKLKLLFGADDVTASQLDTAALTAAIESDKISVVNAPLGALTERDLTKLPPPRFDIRQYINNPFLIGAVVLVMIGILAKFLFSAAQKIEAADDQGTP